MLLCYDVIMVLCYYVIMLLHYYVIMLLCYEMPEAKAARIGRREPMLEPETGARRASG